jgi:hypothetical protein
MSSIFISEDKQRELLANQAAIAIVLGNYQDDKDHTVSDYISKVNSKIKKEIYSGYGNDLILDEVALGNSFRLFSGRGRRGSIETAQEGCSVTKHQNESTDADIAIFPFGYLSDGDTSSFSLKMNYTKMNPSFKKSSKFNFNFKS